MLDCRLSPGRRTHLSCLTRLPRREFVFSPRSHLQKPSFTASQDLRCRTGLSDGHALLRGWSRATVMLLALLTGCTTQGSYQSTRLEAPEAWTMPAPETAIAMPSDEAWWRQLKDPAVDFLAEAALNDSPSVAQAIARVDEARALLGTTSAQRIPSVDVNGNTTRGRSLNINSASGGTILSTQSGVGPGLSWEIDLFGRVRNSVEAGRLRIQARDADAKAARLALTSQIGDLVLDLRACELSIAVLHEEIDSREKTLALTRQRLDTGFVAPIEEARAQSGLASARTTVATRQETCARHINALVAITGQPRATVQGVVTVDTQAAGVAQLVTAIPPTPVVQLAMPATILAAHPAVVAAEREAAAAWSEIAVARAERLPRLDLSAALSGQWLRAAGQSVRETVWSLGPTLAAPVFDGGRGAAMSLLPKPAIVRPRPICVWWCAPPHRMSRTPWPRSNQPPRADAARWMPSPPQSACLTRRRRAGTPVP